MKAFAQAPFAAMSLATVLLAAYMHGHAWFDSGHGLPEGQMIYLGLAPYRDFFVHVTPASYLVTGATFALGMPLFTTLLIQTVLIALTPLAVIWYAYKNTLPAIDTALAWAVALVLSTGLLDGLFHQNTYTVYAECLTFLLILLMAGFYWSCTVAYYRGAALCWGLLLVTHQYYALYTAPLVFWLVLAPRSGFMNARERIYAVALAMAPAVALLAWLFYRDALAPMAADLMFAAYENINKDLNPSLGEWFRSLQEPLAFLAAGDFRSLVKTRSLIPLWLWAISLVILVRALNPWSDLVALRRHVLLAFAFTLLLSLLLVSRHYGGNRILTLLGPEFVFAVLAVALARRTAPRWQAIFFGVAFFGMVASAAAIAHASRDNLRAFFHKSRWAPYTTVSGESLLIDPENAAKFKEAIKAIDAHRACLRVDTYRGVDRMVILGRGNQIYYAVNAIPFLPYTYLEDTLLGEQRFIAVLEKLKALHPPCVAMFTFERYNSPWEKRFREQLALWLKENYSVKYAGDGVYVYGSQ